MAEEDDDDGFGEFTFASSVKSPHYPHPPLQINSLEFPINLATTTPALGLSAAVHDNGKDDDDEWGDFVETPLGSVASSHTPSSKAFDPFDFFSSNPSFQSESIKNVGTESTRHFDSEKANAVATQWVKPKGAIPLSIFGEFDEETEGERSAVGDSHDNNGKDSRNVGEVNDQLKTSNGLENMQLNGQSGFGVSNLSSKINGASLGGKEAILGLGTVEFEFSSVQNRNNSNTSVEHFNGDETVSFENGLNSSSKDTTSSLDALSADFIGQSVSLNQLDTVLSSKYDKRRSMHDGNQVNVDQNEGPKPHSNSVDLNFRKEDNLNLDSWGLDFSGFQSNLVTVSSNINKPNSYSDVPILNSNFGGKSQELHFSGDDEADDDDGWEFKDALSEPVVSHGNVQVQSEVQQLSNAKSFSGGFVVVSNGSANSHPLSDTSFGSFAFSNGISGSPGDIFGLHSNSNAASEIGVFSNTSSTYEQTNGGNGLVSPKEVEISEADDYFGDFATALADSEPKHKAELKLHESADINMPSSEFVNGVNGSINLFTLSNGSADLFFQVNGISNNTDKEFVEFHTEPTVLPENEVDDNYNMYTNSRKQGNGEDADDRHMVVGSNTSEMDFGEFTVAPANTSQIKEGIEIREKIFSKALPLSVFGDKESEMDESLSIADDFLNQHESYKRNDRSANSNVPINDLISQLYNQAEKTSSLDVIPSQSVLIPSNSIMDANLIESANEVCGISWGNTDSSFEDSAASQSYRVPNHVSNENIPPESKLGVYLDFYSKLNDELCQIAKCHPQMLKQAESSSIFSGKDAKVGTCIEEIQEVGTESGQNNAIAREHLVDDQERRGFDLDRFVELLRKSELRVFELQYDLERRLSMVGSDIKTAIELMEHVKTMLKILSFESLENILTYVSMWSEMINACVLEMQHGAQILRESLERNVQSQLLADVRGKMFVNGLCEVYRVAIVIGASTKLYKPWTFLSPESSSSMLSRLEDCHELWNSSGIKEAILGGKSVETCLEKDIVVLLDSIESTSDLDAFALEKLEKHVFTQPESLCRLSLLTPSVAPGLTMVTWENERCFVKIANFWVNLISPDFPKLLLPWQVVK